MIRLFAAGDWTLRRGRAVEASLRAVLLAWGGGADADEDRVGALLARLGQVDHFDPSVVVDRGPFVEQLLALRERWLLQAAAGRADWKPDGWGARPEPRSEADTVDGEARFTGLLSRALTRLHRANLALDEHAIVSIADRRGTIVAVNDRFCEVSGYARAELLGATHRIVKSGRHPPGFYDELWATIASGCIWNGEICNRRKDGSYYWVLSTIIPLPGSDGKPDEYVSVRTEITGAKSSDERLALLENAILASSSGVVVADALCSEFPISYASPSFVRLFARSEPGLPGTSLRELLASGQHVHVVDSLDALLASPAGGSLMLRGQRADGSDYAIDLRLSPMTHAGVTTHVVGVASDATELEATRKVLHDREERLRRSQEHANIGTWDWNIVTGELSWSERIPALFGHRPGAIETTYENFLSCVHPRDRQRVIDAVDACLGLDRPYDIEHRCVWPDGTVRWVHEHGRVIRDERGRPARMLGVVQDVTERKGLECELQRTRERLGEVQALARLGDWAFERTSGDAEWSDAMYAIYRRDRASFRPHAGSFVELAHPPDAAGLERALDAARNGGEADCLHRIAAPSGERRWIRLRTRAQRDESGHVVRVVGTAHDVTDAMRREDCARLLRESIAMNEDAVAVADRYGEILHANDAYRRALGHDPGRRTEGALEAPVAAPFREPLAREIQRRDPAFVHESELPMQRVDGSTFVARNRIRVVHDARGEVQYFVQMFRDAADAFALEAASRRARERMEQARESCLRLVADGSEALLDAARSVLGFARLLAACPELSVVAREYVRHVESAGRRALLAEGERLDLVRAEAGRLSVVLEAVALESILAEAQAGAADAREARPEAGLEARAEAALETDAGPIVRTDRVRIVQALHALRAHAIETTGSAPRMRAEPAGEGFAAIRIALERAGSTGRRPFPFAPLGASAATGPDDARLAQPRLRLATRLVERLNGTFVLARDAVGDESLELRLPALTGERADTDVPIVRDGTPAAPAHPPPSAPASRGTVLCVDDDPASLAVLQDSFRDDETVRVLLSPSAMLGVELAQAHRPDVVLLGIDSVGIDAFALLRAWQDDPALRQVPVIALTGDASPAHRARIEAAGFHRFVEKPVSLPELLRVTNAAVRYTKDRLSSESRTVRSNSPTGTGLPYR